MFQAPAVFLGNDKKIRTCIRFFFPIQVKDCFSGFRKFVCNPLYDRTFPGTGLSLYAIPRLSLAEDIVCNGGNEIDLVLISVDGFLGCGEGLDGAEFSKG